MYHTIEARLALAKTGNSQAAEFILDRAYHGELARIADEQGSQYLKGYVKILIDAANLGSAVRMVRMKKNADFMIDIDALGTLTVTYNFPYLEPEWQCVKSVEDLTLPILGNIENMIYSIMMKFKDRDAFC